MTNGSRGGYYVEPVTLASAVQSDSLEIAESTLGISPEQVQQHCSKDSAWVVLFNKVYDLTSFIPLHPGGDAVILEAAGKDVTTVWVAIHKREWLDEHLKPEWCLGDLVVPKGGNPVVQHEFAKPQAVTEKEDVVFTVTEDYKVLKRRMQKQRPINLGYTYSVIEALHRLQSGLLSKDREFDRMVSIVEERGDPNCTDQDEGGGNSPLLLAACLGSEEHVQRLLQAGADPLYETMRGFTALHKFAARPLPDARAPGVLNALILARCSVNTSTKQGRTPLHVATQWGQIDMCKMLLAKGADKRLRAGVDGTAAEWACVCIKDKNKLRSVLKILDR